MKWRCQSLENPTILCDFAFGLLVHSCVDGQRILSLRHCPLLVREGTVPFLHLQRESIWLLNWNLYSVAFQFSKSECVCVSFSEHCFFTGRLHHSHNVCLTCCATVNFHDINRSHWARLEGITHFYALWTEHLNPQTLSRHKFTSLDYITLHYIILHYITLHYIWQSISKSQLTCRSCLVGDARC